MKPGCYLIKIKPAKPVDFVQYYHGTLRVESVTQTDAGTKVDSTYLRGSADIYSRPDDLPAAFLDQIKEYNAKVAKGADEKINPEKWPDPKQGIPTFPRSQYYGYMEESTIYPGKGHDLLVRFRFHWFDLKTNEFTSRGFLTVLLTPVKEGEACEQFRGKISNDDTGQVVGLVEVEWISDHLRKAVLQIDAIAEAPPPENNGLPKPSSPEGKHAAAAAKRSGLPIQEFADWPTLFEKAGWKLDLETSPVSEGEQKKRLADIKPDLGEPWSDAELHAAMSRLRKNSGVDVEWRYHLLCVGTFANPQYERGVMYDVAGIDTDEAPREGAAIAANWQIPKSDKDDPRVADWQGIPAQTLGEIPSIYFRTAVHEIGHAMGLEHGHGDNSFLNTTDTIARSGTLAAQVFEQQVDELKKNTAFKLATVAATNPPVVRLTYSQKGEKSAAKTRPNDAAQISKDVEKEIDALDKKQTEVRFANNIWWSFSPADLRRLRHGPDVMVRPGAFNNRNLPQFAADAVEEATDLKLYVAPLLQAVTFGAPVRLQLRLKNISDRLQPFVPETLNLKSGFVSGTVIDPRGNSRSFDALMRSLDSEKYKRGGLKSGEYICHSVTLLRGNTGPLFPVDGTYTVQMRVIWSVHGKDVIAQGKTKLVVTPACNTPQRLAAAKLLGAPRALFALALGSKKQDDPETEAALQACLADPFLGPHYRIIEIKRMIPTPIAANKEWWAALAEKIDNAIMSVSEINRVEVLFRHYKKEDKTDEFVKNALKSLKKKRESLVGDELETFPS